MSTKFIPTLTTNHAASSYGVPVLVWNGTAYGTMDTLPTGEVARDFVVRIERGGGKVAARTEDSAPEFVEGVNIDAPAMESLLETPELVRLFLA